MEVICQLRALTALLPRKYADSPLSSMLGGHQRGSVKPWREQKSLYPKENRNAFSRRISTEPTSFDVICYHHIYSSRPIGNLLP